MTRLGLQKKIKMPPNLAILFTSFVTVALGELDFAVHLKGSTHIIVLVKYLVFTSWRPIKYHHIFIGGTGAAERLAEKHHMVNMGEIIPETGYFLLRTKVTTRHLIFSQKQSVVFRRTVVGSEVWVT